MKHVGQDGSCMKCWLRIIKASVNTDAKSTPPTRLNRWRWNNMEEKKEDINMKLDRERTVGPMARKALVIIHSTLSQWIIARYYKG